MLKPDQRSRVVTKNLDKIKIMKTVLTCLNSSSKKNF
jgi:hypothetical protein